MDDVDLDADSTYLLNKYFILPVLSLNTSVTNLDSTVTSFNNSSSVIANTSSIIRLNASTLANTSSITTINASILANTSSIISLNTSFNLSIADINSSISLINTTASTLNTTVTNLSVYVTNFNTSLNLSVADINSSITRLNTSINSIIAQTSYDTPSGNVSFFISPNNTKYLEIGKNASTIVIGPLSQTASLNISTVINGVRIDSNTSNNNLFLSFGNTSYKVASTGGVLNTCNTAVSNNAFSINAMTGDHCTAVGHNCLTRNSTGLYNTAIGSDTLTNVTTGGYNTALGGRALIAATTNSSQVAIGYNALASCATSSYANVAVGHGTLQNYNNSGGGGNTAIGYNALASLTTGLGNIAIGFIADNAPNVAAVNTTGSDNVIIGTDACSGNNSRCIVIGHGAAANANDQIIIGKGGGAHTTWIQGSGGFNVNAGPCSLLGLTVKTTYYQQQWGIGKVADTALYVQAIGTSAGVYMTPSSTGWASLSDRSLKENIIPMESMINKIMNLNPIRYNLIDVSGDRVGFIAQEFNEQFPEFVSETRGKLGISYTELISVLTKCIQEQETKIINLETKNEELISRLSAIESRMSAAGI